MLGQKVVAVDVSCNQRKINGAELHANGVDLAIVKADGAFAKHARAALDGGLELAAYAWSDPSETAETTFSRTMGIIRGWPVKAVAVDMEQYWARWDQWYKAILNKLAWALVARAQPAKIQDRAVGLGNCLRQAGYPALMYTSFGFVSSYVPLARLWLGDWDVWAGHYGRQPAKSVILDWPDFYQKWMPDYKVLPPPGTKSLVGHQFTGDRCKLPGTYADDACKCRSVLDVSVFDRGWYERTVGSGL
jgi:hypothetical protein